MKNLKAYRIRSTDGDNYLIPDDLVELFDFYTKEIDGMTAQDDEYYDIIGRFCTVFDKYIVEGNLYSIELWINPDEL